VPAAGLRPGTDDETANVAEAGRETDAMERYRIEIGRSVAFGLDFLSDAEREQVMRDIERLRENPFPPDAPGVYVAPGAPDGDVFVLPTLGNLRVLFTVGPDHTIFLKNIVNQELVDSIFEAPRSPAAAK
jgi:hypothetical protein